ncbi:GATA transcription factor 8-like [Primulina huaijiensis]|uniref:GATA transcription factor 8-like n=1 Tax=Primulina huaijiensis TaxID=1492673 RepID=UPI003CC6E1D4
MESNFMDEIDCGNFFDQIDDLIEFPPENECVGGNLVGSAECKDFPSMWNDAFPETDVLFSGRQGTAASDISAELFVPYEDIVQLEWKSTFVQDSFSGGGMTGGKENPIIIKEMTYNQYQSSSPVSVLESSSSSSSSSRGKTLPLCPNHQATQRARTKRPRPKSFNPRAVIQPLVPPPGFSSEPEFFAESLQVKKTKKIKFSMPANPMEAAPNPPPQSIRKCLHCEITKTPQWRAGPMGPKTLCNACGVRHKSGRLFPEYRPAASPTFVPSLHSNSHKKVVEMRSKADPISAATTAPASVKPE